MTDTVAHARQPDALWGSSLTLAAPSVADAAWPGVEWRPSAERAIDRVVNAGQLSIEEHVRRIAVSLLAGLWSVPSSVPFGLAPQAFPLPGRGLQLEWHGGPDHVEISIESTGAVGLYAQGSAGATDVEIEVNRSPIPRFVVETLQRITAAAWQAHASR